MFLYLVSMFFCIWVIFLGGAERLENTLLGYLEFGNAAEKVTYIKVCAWLALILSVVIVLFSGT